ncbi:methionyl-tRNA formyltransferase [Campylobacter corcagiensis]|uniref:Methionyl-tRNA formyltransferase n=1 Tax=Campylobacter corcagiensis TaxID=1448857 RepID=A0A7M1LDH5_9BACT|nr:methionyl-tRNA formyltransferase [Campylobacter corcagiensis]QKF65255.1 10-formyltetrahydrofolate:L-methionyl-tRNA(fMet) N-formyltransferase [Campylobacter corcagiensis]QOQ86612.1 methionyl-tRNA formyltransferase [Campylobacter corcagiensis]
MSKKVIFMGTPDYALTILKALVESEFEVVAVYTQPDKPVGRKKVITPPVVKTYALEKNIPVFQPINLKDDGIKDQISAFKPDYIIVAAYGQILPKSILDITHCINLHASILPKFRGASPIQEAILQGENLSGVTAMSMSEGLDDGDMLAFSFVDIKDKSSNEVFEILADVAANLALKTLRNFNDINPIAQFNALSSKCGKVKKSDGLVKFSDDIIEVEQKLRAYTPWPGIFLEDGTKILSAKKAQISGNLGEILDIKDDSFTIGFSGGSLEIYEIQEAAKKPLKAKEYINGKRLKVGDRIY